MTDSSQRRHNPLDTQCSLRSAWNVKFYPISFAAETSDASKSWDTSETCPAAHLDPMARKPGVSCTHIAGHTITHTKNRALSQLDFDGARLMLCPPIIRVARTYKESYPASLGPHQRPRSRNAAHGAWPRRRLEMELPKGISDLVSPVRRLRE